MANRVQALISKIYNFGMQRDLVQSNPAHKVAKPGTESERERALNSDELAAVWRALEAEPQHLQVMFKLMLLTGQRPSEVRMLPWKEIDFQTGWWTIPGSRAKNKKTHRVPLTPEVRRLLESMRGADAGEFVFSGRSGKGPIWSPQKSLRRITERAVVTKFTIHDLRRTVTSGFGELGISRTVMQKVLNHTDPSVTRIYDRYSYDAEKVEALTRWERRVLDLVKSAETMAAA